LMMTKETNNNTKKTGKKDQDVPVAWEALEDAFENNAPEVHSYLHLETGEVIRIVDGIADPAMHARVMSDPNYLRVDPVSSREQYRWMERFIATVEESEFRNKLLHAIDGKGAFRRFKDVLMSYPVDRERWFQFRSERLRSCMESWLTAHGIKAVERPKWRVPTADEVQKEVTEAELEKPARRTRAVQADAIRTKIHELIDTLPARELDAALAYLDYLRERRHLPRAAQKSLGPKRPDDGAPFDPNEPELEGDDRDDVEASESDEA
jgi:hypothetical protein